jgi:tetratricopeptide (TPR) repeat protein
VPPSGAHARMVTLRFSTPGLVVLAVGSLGLGAVLIGHAWRADQVFRYRVGAFRAMQRAKLPDPELAIQYLSAASELMPLDAELHLELGQFYLNFVQPQSPRFTAEALIPGMRQMITARNLCPLLPRPQLRLAVYAPKLERADPPESYWKRAERLAPYDPDLWYLHGVQLLRDKRPAEAYSCWKQSLVLSPRHLPQILDAGLPILGVDGLIAHVLPEDPELLIKAATRLELMKPPPAVLSLYKKAYELLNARTDNLTASDFYLRARCAEQLGETEAAMKAYKQALVMNESPHEWRWRYAKLLHRAGKLQEAQRELLRLRQLFPDNREIVDEYDLVSRELEIQP